MLLVGCAPHFSLEHPALQKMVPRLRDAITDAINEKSNAMVS
jgi:hypothetical protein